jgi:hypothetical protein
MQSAGPVALHHEAARLTGRPRRRRPDRFRRFREVTLGLIGLELPRPLPALGRPLPP